MAATVGRAARRGAQQRHRRPPPRPRSCTASGPATTCWCPTFTFAASVNAIRLHRGHAGADRQRRPATWNLSPDLVAEELAARRDRPAQGGHPRRPLRPGAPTTHAIVPLLAEHGVLHLVDAAESLGATYAGRPAASYGDLAVAVVQRQQDHHHHRWRDARHRRRRAWPIGCATSPPRRGSPCPTTSTSRSGYNYRLSNLLAAFGRAQLADLDRRVERRRAIFDRYVAGARPSVPGIGFMPEAPYGRANRWLTCITIDAAVAGVTPGGAPRCTSRRSTSRPGPPGSRCTCSRCSATARAGSTAPRRGSSAGPLPAQRQLPHRRRPGSSDRGVPRRRGGRAGPRPRHRGAPLGRGSTWPVPWSLSEGAWTGGAGRHSSGGC